MVSTGPGPTPSSPAQAPASMVSGVNRTKNRAKAAKCVAAERRKSMVSFHATGGKRERAGRGQVAVFDGGCDLLRSVATPRRVELTLMWDGTVCRSEKIRANRSDTRTLRANATSRESHEPVAHANRTNPLRSTICRPRPHAVLSEGVLFAQIVPYRHGCRLPASLLARRCCMAFAKPRP